MTKSLVLLASFAGLVACFGEKSKEETVTDGQATTTETCPAAAPAVEEPAAPAAAPAVEANKPEEPAAPTAETTEPKA